MLRFVVVTTGVVAVALTALFHQFEVASLVGIVLGVAYLALSLSRNNGFINASLKRDPDRPNDPNAGISMGLGAAGLASTAVSNPHYPTSFRIFYAGCLVAGLIIAETLAVKYRSAPVPRGANETLTPISHDAGSE